MVQALAARLPPVSSGSSNGLGGLFDGFEGHRVAGDNEVTEILKTALISIDANVLLGLYRYPDDFGTSLLSALESMADRVFVSRQAITEFWRNRTSALADRARARAEVEKRLAGAERSVLDAVENWAKQTTLDESDLEQAQVLVRRQFEVLNRVVSDNHRDDVENYPSSGLDPIVESLAHLLDGRVGEPLPVEEHEEAVAEGQRRHKVGLPPGYREKLAEKEHLPEGVSGDYLIWRQSVLEAKRRGTDLLLVTSDVKDDWYWRSRETVIGPRPELAKEFWDETQMRLVLLTPVEYLRYYQAQGGDVSEQALIEVERHSSTTTGSEPATEATESRQPRGWTLSAVDQLLDLLDREAPIQAAVIRAAAANGGTVPRERVYEIGGFTPKRMLRGFTRPVRRCARRLQELGELDLDAPDMLTPRYDSGVQASAFEIPADVVELLRD